MLMSIKNQKDEFNKHIDKLVAQCPGKNQMELFHEFLANDFFDSTVDENYFYDFTLSFEMFLYFHYHVNPSNFKYFDLERFYA